MTFAPANSQAPFLNTSIVFSEDESERLYELTKFATDTALYINQREIGAFPLTEVLTGQQFFNPSNVKQPRQAFRSVFSFGAIATGASISVNHNLTGFTSFTHIYGTVITDVVDYRPIPYASNAIATDQVAIKVSSTQFIIAVGVGFPNVTSGILVLEYLKS